MSGNPKRIRKQAYDLTIADLDAYPLWEFCLDEEGDPGQDESTMRPLVTAGPVSYRDFDGIVATDFRTPSNQLLFGVIQPSGYPNDPYTWSPSIRLDRPAGEYLDEPLLKRWNPILQADSTAIDLTLPLEQYFPEDEARVLIAYAYKALGVEPGGMFPLTARPRVAIQDWPRELRIDGFLRPFTGGSHDVLTY